MTTLQEQTVSEKDLQKSWVGSLVSITKQEGDDCGTAKWSIAEEGVLDKDGDRFDVGSLEMERERGTVAKFQHNNEPAGTWTMTREGNTVYANVSFLDTTAGQDCRKYVQAMGKSAQFSFRGRMKDYYFPDDVPGIAFRKVSVYETSPVYIGGGETNLQAIKAAKHEEQKEETQMDPEVIKEKEQETMPTWAVDLSKSVTSLAETVATLKPAQPASPEPTQLEVVRKNIETLSDVEKQALGITDLSKGSQAEPPTYDEVFKNGGPEDLMKAMYEKTDDICKVAKDGNGSAHIEFRSNPVDVMKAVLPDVGTVQDRIPTALNVAEVTAILDMLPMRPVSGNSVTPPVLSADTFAGTTVRDPHGGPSEASAELGAPNFPVRLVQVTQPIARSDIEDDPSLIPVITADIIRSLRRRVLFVVANGQSGQQAVGGLVAAVTGTGRATTLTAGNEANPAPDILAGATQGTQTNFGMEYLLGELMNTVMPNMIICRGADYAKLFTAQRANYYLAGPGGAPMAHAMGVPAFAYPQMPANTILMGWFDMDTFFIGLRRDIRVEVSYEQGFSNDQVIFKGTVRMANVVRQIEAFHKILASNFYTAGQRS